MNIMEINLDTLYNINKKLIKNEPLLSEEELKNKIEELIDYISNKKYVMFLCNERRDYTVFHDNCHPLAHRLMISFEDVKETLTNRGNIVCIDYEKETDSYEIWIRDNSENFLYKFFDYSNGIVEV